MYQYFQFRRKLDTKLEQRKREISLLQRQVKRKNLPQSIKDF